MASDEFKVRDLRNKGFHMVDDAYMNGYAKLLDPHATVVYLCLCRHADRHQESYPSQKLISEKTNIGLRTVVKKIALLEEWNLIKIERVRDASGKFKRNIYLLLDKSEWKPLPSASNAPRPSASGDNNQVHQMHTKETQEEGNKHIKYINKSGLQENDQSGIVLEHWNKTFGTAKKSTVSFKDNLNFWLEVYTLDEIKQAITTLKDHHFWKDKMKIETLFRKKNPNREHVDYIGQMLEYKPQKEKGGITKAGV